MNAHVQSSQKIALKKIFEPTYYLVGARFWDPQLGIWLSHDPARQFNNPYGFGGDPINYVDPDGEFVHIIV